MGENFARGDPVTDGNLQHGLDEVNAFIPLVWVGLMPLAHAKLEGKHWLNAKSTGTGTKGPFTLIQGLTETAHF